MEQSGGTLTGKMSQRVKGFFAHIKETGLSYFQETTVHGFRLLHTVKVFEVI